MENVKIIISLALFLILKTTIGQPINCNCRIAFISNGSAHYNSCNTRGCSVGTNPFCDKYYFIDFRCCDGGLYGAYYGCNCPNSAYTANHNGAYGPARGEPSYNYNYTTCTDYGFNARDGSGSVPYGANIATDCCNYCCDRNDPYSTTTTTTTTTTAIPTTTTPVTTTKATTAGSTTAITSTTTETIHTTTSTATSDGRTMMLDKLFHMSGLIMSVLITLKANYIIRLLD